MIFVAVETKVAEFGIEVRSVGVKDVILPGDMKHILNQVVEAEKVDFDNNEAFIEEIQNEIKGIRYRKPPRSVYSQLPRKFCFSKTHNAPEFLYQDKQFRRTYKKIDNSEWYYMAL